MVIGFFFRSKISFQTPTRMDPTITKTTMDPPTTMTEGDPSDTLLLLARSDSFCEWLKQL